MIHKFFYGLFLALGILICLFPLLGLTVTGPAPALGKERLAFSPKLKTETGGVNLQFLSDTCDYFRDHFSCRQELITLNAKLESDLLGDSASEEVVLGKDGWLFLAETMDDYQGMNQLSDRQVWAAAHTLSLIQEHAQRTGIRFLFTVAPNKNSLYPQFMPNASLRADGPGNLDRLYAALNDQGVACLDLRGEFQSQDRILYQRLDSHWSNLGAALACDRILAAIGKEPDAFYDPSRFIPVQNHQGDLYEMLYPTGTEKDIQYEPNPPLQFRYVRPIRSPEDLAIRTSCEGQEGSLLMFRDSFGNTLHSFMAESYEKAFFSRAMPYDLSLMNASQPDTLVIEIVQRHIPWLAQRAPKMYAPERELQLPAEQTDADADLSCVQDAHNDVLWCLSGTLNTPVDVDSPIYLLVNGTVYEASPVGETEGAFTAYLSEKATQAEVLYVRNGILCRTTDMTCIEKGETNR